MPGPCFRRLTAVALVFAVASLAAAGEIYSTMRNVNAVVEAHGFRLNPAGDIQPTPLPTDLSPAQAFEIVRPLDRPVTIGRLFTSCSCIQLESQKRTFAPGERAILILRNIRPTPPAGQVYAVFVQVTSPVRTTLRFDTFVQSGTGPNASGAQGNIDVFEPPEVAPHPRIGSGTRSPAALLDDELERFGESASSNVAEAEEDGESEAREENDSLVIRELNRPAAQASLGDLPQLAAIPPQVRRTPATAEVIEGTELDAIHDMTPRLDGEELEGYLAATSVNPSAGLPGLDDMNLQLPEGADVRDSLGVARGDLEDLYTQNGGNPELAANVDAARQAMDNYFRRERDDDETGTADLAVAVDIDRDIPDFYAHMPATPVPAAEAETPAPETAAAGTWESPEEAEDPGIQANRIAMANQDVPAPTQVASSPGVVPGLSASEFGETPGVSAGLPMVETPEARRPAEVAAAITQQQLYPTPAPVSAAPSTPQRNPDAPKPVQAVSLITVGVRDMPSSIRFYEALGWRRAAPNKYDQTAFFQLQGQILALYPMNDQLREQNMPNAAPVPGGITLALHVHDKADVWSVYQRFIDAGGQSLRPPAEMASGAVTSYVADPDGNPWEISWVPQFRIDEEGGLWLP